jgi:hypothetical protein
MEQILVDQINVPLNMLHGAERELGLLVYRAEKTTVPCAVSHDPNEQASGLARRPYWSNLESVGFGREAIVSHGGKDTGIE